MDLHFEGFPKSYQIDTKYFSSMSKDFNAGLRSIISNMSLQSSVQPTDGSQKSKSKKETTKKKEDDEGQEMKSQNPNKAEQEPKNMNQNNVVGDEVQNISEM